MYESKKEELDSLISSATDGTIKLYYFDESGFNLNPHIPYAWNEIDQTLSIAAKRSQNLNVLGFLDTKNSDLFSYTIVGKVDSDVVIGVFDKFVETLTKDTVVVLDNAAIHTSKKFMAKIDEWKSKGLILFFLPPYSPQLNPIEILWKLMKYHWIDFDAYLSFENLKNYVDTVLANYGTTFEINFT